MSVLNLMRIGVIKNILRTKEKKVDGNMKGEGRLLGGKYIIDHIPPCAYML